MRYLAKLAFALGLAAAICTASAQTPEEKLKAALVYNFAKFITWPGGAFALQTYITICVVGKDGEIEEAIAPLARPRRSREGHRAAHDLRWGALQGCEVAYIARSERSRLGGILQSLSGSPVLTVSDVENFAGSGGMIGLVSDGNKVVFEVNLGEIDKAGLKVNAQLLKVAKVVHKGKT